MPKQRTSFFASDNDMLDFLKAVAISIPCLQYAPGGLSNASSVEPNNNLLSLSHSKTSFDATVRYPYFIISSDTASISPRVIRQNSGAVVYSIDQTENPHTIILRRGGVYDGHHLVAGEIVPSSDSDECLRIFLGFLEQIKKQFKKIKGAYVGPEAYALLQDGWRLTTNVKSPRIYDLSEK